MPIVYVSGNPKSEDEKKKLLEEAFDDYMLKVPLEQRRFLRRFGFSETEIDIAIRDPEVLAWDIRPD